MVVQITTIPKLNTLSVSGRSVPVFTYNRCCSKCCKCNWKLYLHLLLRSYRLKSSLGHKSNGIRTFFGNCFHNYVIITCGDHIIPVFLELINMLGWKWGWVVEVDHLGYSLFSMWILEHKSPLMVLGIMCSNPIVCQHWMDGQSNALIAFAIQ